MATHYRLDANNPAIVQLSARDKHLAKAIRMVGPLEYELSGPPYAFLVSEIMGQMLSNKVADVFYQRLLTLCAGNVTPETVGGLSDEQLRGIGIAKSKVGYIRNLTVAVNTGKIDFDALTAMTDQDVMRQLTAVRGIGNWSAKMYLIFVLNRPDVLPFEDVAFLQGYGWLFNTDDWRPAAVKKKCRKWRPYTSIAARYMYEVLDRGLTKEKFHLFKD